MDELEGLLSTDAGVFTVTIRRNPEPEPVAEVRPRRRQFSKTTREWLLRVQQHRCAICRGPLSFFESHIDHIVPLVAGGTDDIANLQLTHMGCNLRKGSGRGPYDKQQERMPWA